MKILHVASEAFPLIKTGGLADVAYALPRAQKAMGLDVRVLLPGYPSVLRGLSHIKHVADIGSVFGAACVRLLMGKVRKLGNAFMSLTPRASLVEKETPTRAQTVANGMTTISALVF